MFSGLIAAMMLLPAPPTNDTRLFRDVEDSSEKKVHYTMIIIRSNGELSAQSTGGLAQIDPERCERLAERYKKQQRELLEMKRKRIDDHQENLELFDRISIKRSDKEKQDAEKIRQQMITNHQASLQEIDESLKAVIAEIRDLTGDFTYGTGIGLQKKYSNKSDKRPEKNRHR